MSWDTAVSCLTRLVAQNGAPADIEAAGRRNDLDAKTVPLSRLVELAAELGLLAEPIELDWQKLKTTGFAHPLLILRKNDDLVMVTGGGRSQAEEVSVWDPHHDGVVFFVPREDFERSWNGHALIITPADHGSTPLHSRLDDKTASGADDEASPAPPPRRSLRQRLCFAAIAVVAAGSIGILLLTYSGSDHLASTATPVPASAGAATIVPVAPIPESASNSATPVSAEPATGATPADTPLAPKTQASPATPPPEVARSTVLEPAAPVLSSVDIAALLARGDAFFRQGDLAAARLYYERAVDAGDGQAAIRLGETFDPVFLGRAQLRGAQGDVVTALSWYLRARELGAAEAGALLESLEIKQER